jgi:hypothetical protein
VEYVGEIIRMTVAGRLLFSLRCFVISIFVVSLFSFSWPAKLSLLSFADVREKQYDSRGIGCYMFGVRNPANHPGLLFISSPYLHC